MSAIQKKQTKKEQSATQLEVQESIEIPLPQPKKKEKGSSKQEPAPAHVVVDIVDDDSTPSVAVEPKPSKKEKGSSKQKEKDIVDDDSTPTETKPSKKGKKTVEQVESDEVEPAPKRVIRERKLNPEMKAKAKLSRNRKNSLLNLWENR